MRHKHGSSARPPSPKEEAFWAKAEKVVNFMERTSGAEKEAAANAFERLMVRNEYNYVPAWVEKRVPGTRKKYRSMYTARKKLDDLLHDQEKQQAQTEQNCTEGEVT